MHIDHHTHMWAHAHVLSEHTFNEYNFQTEIQKKPTQILLYYQEYEIEKWRIRVEQVCSFECKTLTEDAWLS